MKSSTRHHCNILLDFIKPFSLGLICCSIVSWKQKRSIWIIFYSFEYRSKLNRIHSVMYSSTIHSALLSLKDVGRCARTKISSNSFLFSHRPYELISATRHLCAKCLVGQSQAVHDSIAKQMQTSPIAGWYYTSPSYLPHKVISILQVSML